MQNHLIWVVPPPLRSRGILRVLAEYFRRRAAVSMVPASGVGQARLFGPAGAIRRHRYEQKVGVGCREVSLWSNHRAPVTVGMRATHWSCATSCPTSTEAPKSSASRPKPAELNTILKGGTRITAHHCPHCPPLCAPSRQARCETEQPPERRSVGGGKHPNPHWAPSRAPCVVARSTITTALQSRFYLHPMADSTAVQSMPVCNLKEVGKDELASWPEWRSSRAPISPNTVHAGTCWFHRGPWGPYWCVSGLHETHCDESAVTPMFIFPQRFRDENF